MFDARVRSLGDFSEVCIIEETLPLLRLSSYEGTDDPNGSAKIGLKSFEDLEDISIVAAPGSTCGFENSYRSDAAR
jgi:hypothetical protein